MSKVVDPPFVAETLTWCNERRTERFMAPLERLPKGERSDGYSCPCGKATGLWVGGTVWGENALSMTEVVSAPRLPRAVIQFVDEFDKGQLPQYDEDPLEERS